MSLQDDIKAGLADPKVEEALELRELRETTAKVEAHAIVERSLGYAELLTEALMRELIAHGMIHSGVAKAADEWLQAVGYPAAKDRLSS